jgi:hypothetical protein
VSGLVGVEMRGGQTGTSFAAERKTKVALKVA